MDLVEIPRNKWIHLRDLYKIKWPEGAVAYCVLDLHITTPKLSDVINFKVYSADGDITNGMVATNDTFGYFQLFIHPLNDITKTGKALQNTNDIDWNRRINVPAATDEAVECLKMLQKRRKIDIRYDRISYKYFFDNDTEFDDSVLPPDCYVASLKPEHVSLVDETWPYQRANTSKFFETLMDHDMTYVLYSIKDDKPMAWTAVNVEGHLTHIYTLEPYRRKGYEEQWYKLESSLKLDWPRSILIINLLETLKQIPELRRKFDFKIYCPHGDVTIGVVITCLKKTLYEVIIHCNRNMKTLSEAIKGSKLINWELTSVEFTDRQLMESVISTMQSVNVEFYYLLSCDTIYLDRNLFDIQMPQNLTFGLLSIKHVPQVNSTWEHRYSGSEWYFEQLVQSNLGYGLFEKDSNKLVAWVFYTESGTFDNMHVLDSYRRKGYGELLVKLSYNIVRKNKDYVYTFCVKGNSVALAMFEQVGFKVIGETFWTVLMSKTRSKL